MLGTDQMGLGVQLSSSVYYASVGVFGSLRWAYNLPVEGFQDLVGFSNFNYQSFGLIINCVQDGKNVSKIIEVNNTDGSIRSSSIAGTEDQENKYLDLTYFTQTLDIVGVIHLSAGYQLVRNLNETSDKILTQDTYKIQDSVGFSITAATDNANDAMGFCLPQEGKLVFIKHFSYYSTIPDFSKEYAVPIGATITSITRSLQDGGFLFALNTADNKKKYYN